MIEACYQLSFGKVEKVGRGVLIKLLPTVCLLVVEQPSIKLTNTNRIVSK